MGTVMSYTYFLEHEFNCKQELLYVNNYLYQVIPIIIAVTQWSGYHAYQR
jgi:hypothetical protein